MATTINKKINHIYLLLEKLATGEELYPQNPRLQSELDVNERTLRRYLEDIYSLYSHIVLIQKVQKEFSDRKVTVYKVANKEQDVSNIFKFFLQNSDDLSWLLQIVYENNPTLLKDYKDDTKKSLEKILKDDEDIFLFVNSPFEKMDNEKFSSHFTQLKTAVKNHEYRDIEYQYTKSEMLKDLKCLKLIHMNNNWYIGVETKKNKLRFLRLAFIKKINYSNTKVGFQLSVLEKYNTFFSSIQNAMTRNKPFKEALLKATPNISIYFKKNMKPFFPSQKFIQEDEDGNIIFSIQYTSFLEIAPFIKQWQPDLIVLSPDNLKEKIMQDLLKSMTHYKESL